MINNINVADCEFRGYCNICKLKSGSNCPTDCKDNPNCYYKQLQAKEQECERLKGKFIVTLGKTGLRQSDKEFYEQQLDQLKSDNKHLNGLLDQALKELEEMRELNDENSLRVTQLATKCCQLEEDNEELKEIIQRHDNDNNALLSEVEDDLVAYYGRYKQALEKVREVCTKYKEICANCECDEYIDCVDCTEGGKAKLAIQILQICDEVNE